MTVQDCPRCGQVPTPPTADGRLFLWPPLGHTLRKVSKALRADGVAVTPDEAQGSLVLPVARGGHAALADRLDAVMTRAEQRDCRALFMPGQAEPGLAQMGQVDSLATFIARVQGAWLMDLMRERRVTTLFQPILHVAEPTRVFAHECLLRGLDQDGATIPPGRMFDVATRADLVFPLDRLARTTAVANAAARGVSGYIFINFTPAAVYDPANCLRTTLEAVEAAGLDRDRIVFEVIETEEIRDPAHLAGVLAWYRDAGFKVALDDLGGGYAGLGLLPSLRPDFIKLDRSLVDGVSADRVKAVVIGRVVEMARDLGIRVIAEGVEAVADLAWLQDTRVDFVQGFLLARPAPDPIAGL